jgi:hypothetical protein
MLVNALLELKQYDPIFLHFGNSTLINEGISLKQLLETSTILAL